MRNFIAQFSLSTLLICQSVLADNSNWMAEYGQFIQNKPLNRVFIPGTHDSGTYHLENNIARGQDISKDIGPLLKIPGINNVFRNWAQCQERNISQQLADGIRFFDFRIVYRDSEQDFFIAHGLYAKRFSNELQAIADFLRNHPSEIVIIQASHMNYMPEGEASHHKLISLIQAILGPMLAPASFGPNVTVQELWNNQKQVIFIYDDEPKYSQSYPGLWSGNTLSSYWANATDPNELKQKLDQNINQAFANGTSINQFFVVQSQLTPDTNTIKAAFNPFGNQPRSTKDLSNQIKCRLPQWIDEWTQKPVNIILHDFATPQTAHWVIQKNNPANLNIPLEHVACPKSTAIQDKFAQTAKTVVDTGVHTAKEVGSKIGHTAQETGSKIGSTAQKAGQKIKGLFHRR